MDQRLAVTRLFHEFHLGHGDSGVIDQRFARFQPQVEKIVGEHRPQRPSTVSGQRGGE